jgi:hypothetical protein
MSETGKSGVLNQPIEVILAWFTTGVSAMPEIQQPFVRDITKVRDRQNPVGVDNLLDSLY